MKVGNTKTAIVAVLVLALVCPLSGVCYHRMPASKVLKQTLHRSGKVKVYANGTATASGAVIENSHACEIDARCYLRLRVGDRERTVVYGPAEGDKVR